MSGSSDLSSPGLVHLANTHGSFLSATSEYAPPTEYGPFDSLQESHNTLTIRRATGLQKGDSYVSVVSNVSEPALEDTSKIFRKLAAHVERASMRPIRIDVRRIATAPELNDPTPGQNVPTFEAVRAHLNVVLEHARLEFQKSGYIPRTVRDRQISATVVSRLPPVRRRKRGDDREWTMQVVSSVESSVERSPTPVPATVKPAMVPSPSVGALNNSRVAFS